MSRAGWAAAQLDLPTLIISDLHLGSAGHYDVLRNRGQARSELLKAIHPGSKLVIAGDLLELRHGSAAEISAHAADLLRDLGQQLGPTGHVLITAGNHDHRIFKGWLEDRQFNGRGLDLEQVIEPAEVSQLALQLADCLAPANVKFAYPGAYVLAPGVSSVAPNGIYVMHGHYSDVFLTLPTFERLISGVAAKIQSTSGSKPTTPLEFERLVQPGYAWSDAIAEHAVGDGASVTQRTSASVWEQIQNRRSVKGYALRAGIFAAVNGLKLVGIDGMTWRLTPESLRLAGINAMREAIEALTVPADFVIAGHTHRAGPQKADPLSEWQLSGGRKMLNSGCWVHGSEAVSGGEAKAPYWPGRAVQIVPGKEPEVVSLLEQLNDPWAGQERN